MTTKTILQQIKDGLLYGSLVINLILALRKVISWRDGFSIILVGVIISTADLLYKNERISNRSVFIIHYLITVTTILAMDLINTWIKFSLGTIISEWVIISIVYFIVWTISHFRNMNYVKQSNELINNIKSRKM